MKILYYHFIIFSALFSVYLGFYTLYTYKRSPLNRSFFRLALLFCLVSTATFFAVTAKDGETSRRILNKTSLLWFLFPLFFLQFITTLTEKKDSIPNRFLPWSLFLPLTLYITSLKYDVLFNPFKKAIFGWSHSYKIHSPFFIMTTIYYFSYIFLALLFLLRWRQENRGSIKQRQADIILLATVSLAFLTIIYRKLFSYFFHIIIPPLFPVFLNVWLSAVAYAISKFHLMSNIPKIVQSNILSHISDMVIIIDLDKNITYANKRTLQITGFSLNDILHKPASILFDDIYLDDISSKETLLNTSTTARIPVMLTCESFKDRHDFVLSYVITVSDIRILKTLQKQIKQKEHTMLKLRESEIKYSKVFNASPTGLVSFHLSQGTILEANNMILHIIGYSREEIERIGFFLSSILLNNPENRKLIHDIISKENILNRNCVIRTKKKDKKTLLLSVERMNLQGDHYLLLACNDITDSEKIKAQLLRTQKMDSIGILAGGIAHDFNNMLAIIKGNISLTLSEITDTELREYLDDALRACNNAANLTSQLLTFSRGKKSEKRILDINDVINSSISIAFSGKDCVPVFYPDADFSTIYGNKNQLQQIFINLFINALQASKNKGEVTVSTTNDTKNKKIIISVTDFGTGISEKDIDTIFDPFFSTKKKGTGLGLSIVYSVVHNHGGTIEASSSQQRGTTFTLTFPLRK